MKSVKLALIVTVVFGLFAGSAFALPHHIYKVSDSLGVTQHHNYHPEVAGDYLAWGNYSNGIHRYDWTTKTHTTYGGSRKCYAVVNENGDVVWTNNESSSSGRDHYWDNTNLTGTERAVDYMSLDQDGNTAAWSTYFIGTTSRYDISYDVNNSGTPTVISAGTAWKRNRAPDTDSSSVVWHDDSTTLVYRYDIGTAAMTVIGNGMVGGAPNYLQGVKVDGNYAVWNYSVGANTDIMLHDISAGTNTMLWDSALTGQSAVDPKISGNYVVWEGHAGFPNTNIFLYDLAAATTLQLTTTGMNRDPSIDGDYIAWVDLAATDYDVLVYQISTGITTTVTGAGWTEVSNGNPTYGAPQVYDIGGDYIVTWTYHDSSLGLAAVALSVPIPEPATLCMLGAALAVAAGIIRKRLH